MADFITNFWNGLNSTTMSPTPENAEVDIEEAPKESPLSKDPGYYLRWSRLMKRVEVKDAASGGLVGQKSISASQAPRNDGRPASKVILDNVSGYAAPGEVLACMGPSGSGKTSLMNVLSGRSTYQDGVISINGDALTAQTMKRLMSKVAYVKQADIFFEHLSVRDQLTYTALLRMPSALSLADKHAEVERVIQWLRLTKVADSPMMLISGGEKKRVNIGTELLNDPKVLLLDEPTSGLDSTTAVALIRLLQHFARERGKTVITSIHQPSSAVFRSFDRLLLLSEGKVVYFGTPLESLDHLRAQNLACPDGYNAADHWMDLLVHDSATEDPENDESDALMASTGRSREPSNVQLERAWDNESVAVAMDHALHHAATSTSNINLEGGRKYNTSWLTQYMILTHRALKNSRSAIFTPLNLVKSLVLGIIAGGLWYRTDYTERNVFDIQSFYFFTMTYWVFDAMFNAMTAFPAERVVVDKERASASYHLSAYFLAKTTSDAPVRLSLPFLYITTAFWMASIDTRFHIFIGSIGCTLLSVLAGEAIGLFIGASVPDFQTAITLMTVVGLGLMLTGGFFVENIPSFLSWLKYLSPFKYAFDSSLRLVFDRPVPCDGSGALEEICGGRSTGFATAEQVQQFIDLDGSLGFNVGVLLVICFFPRYMAYLALRRSKGGDRS